MATSVMFPGANIRMTAPKGDEEMVAETFAFTNGKTFVTCWELTEVEMAKIRATGKIFLCQVGNGMQPVFIGDDTAVRDLVSGYGLTIPQQK